MKLNNSKKADIDNLKKRLYTRSKKDGECLIWQGYKNPKGYGQINFKRKAIFTHRAAWLINYNKNIPKGKLILHSCDRPSCIKISHLRIGTAADNTEDMMQRKRHKPIIGKLIGEKNPLAKLTECQVIEIKNEINKNEKTLVEIARDFNASEAAIYDIKRNRSWKYIKIDIKRDGLTVGQKLNIHKVKEIKELIKQNYTVADIAKKYDVKWMTIYDIKKNRRWKHV